MDFSLELVKQCYCIQWRCTSDCECLYYLGLHVLNNFGLDVLAGQRLDQNILLRLQQRAEYGELRL